MVSEVSLDPSALRQVMGVMWRSGYAGALRHLSGRHCRCSNRNCSSQSCRRAGSRPRSRRQRRTNAGRSVPACRPSTVISDLLVTLTMPIPAFDAG